MLRGRLVDQPNPILAVDDDEGLAQVLDDVIVELDEVAQIEPALRGERLGLDDSCAQQLHDGGDHEDRRAEDPYRHILCARCHPLQLGEGLLEEQDQCSERSQHEAALGLERERERAYGDHEEPAEAARDSAARVDQQRDRGKIRAELRIRLHSRAREASRQQHELHAADAEHPEQHDPSELRICLADDPRRDDVKQPAARCRS